MSLSLLETSFLEMKSYIEYKLGHFFFMFLRVSIEESIKFEDNKLSSLCLSWISVTMINFSNAVFISSITGFCNMTQTVHRIILAQLN